MGECEGGSVGRVEWEGGRGVEWMWWEAVMRDGGGEEWEGGGAAGTESVGGGALVSN
jgi:hypothetical protein